MCGISIRCGPTTRWFPILRLSYPIYFLIGKNFDAFVSCFVLPASNVLHGPKPGRVWPPFACRSYGPILRTVTHTSDAALGLYHTAMILCNQPTMKQQQEVSHLSDAFSRYSSAIKGKELSGSVHWEFIVHAFDSLCCTIITASATVISYMVERLS